MTLGAGEQTHTSEHSEEHTSASLFNTGATRFGSLDPEQYSRTSQNSTAQTWSIGSTLSGDTVTVAAGHDLTGTAVQIAGTHDVTLAAGNDLTLNAGKDTYSESDGTTVSRTGLMNGGGFSALIGNRTIKNGNTVQDTSYTGSLVGSTNGAVTLTAGHDVHITGSDVLSQTATTIVGQNVTIDAAVGSTDTTQTQSVHSGGIHVGLSGGAVSVAQSVYGAAQGASHSSDSRLKALYAMQAAQDLYSPGAAHGLGLSNGESGAQTLGEAVSDPHMAQGKGDNNGGSGINLQVGITGSTARSEAHTHDDTTYGSTIRSNGNVTIAATNGDLNVIGSQIDGQNVALAASHDLNLLSQAEQHTDTNHNSNASGGVGISIGSSGFGLYAQAALGQGKAHGNGTTHTDTVVNAADMLTLIAGNDATIQGAQAKGNTVLADIGHNLNIASEQDTNDYASTQWQAAGQVVIGAGASGSASFSQSTMDSHYKSVTQMSGIGAGNGGFDIHVGGNTNLLGAVIASTADPSKNLLDTGTLSYGNLQNESKYSATSVSVGSGGMAGLAGLTGLAMPQGSNASSTTQAAIANGTLVTRDHPGQSLAGLSRDASLDNANGLTNSFNPQKIAENQQLAQVAGQVGMTAVGDISAYMANHATTEADQKAWSDGGANKVLLHGLVGAAVASLGGNNALQGGLGAAASETASGAMEQYLVDHGISPYSSEGKSLLGLASAAIGGAVGGGAGATTALQGEQFNQQLHPEMLNELLSKVGAFAKEYGLSESDAKNRLLLEAMRLQDNGFNQGISTDQIGGSQGVSDDAQARAFLAANDNFTVNGQAVDIFKPAAPNDSATNAYALYNYLYQNPAAAQAFYGAQEYGQAERGNTSNDSQQNQLLAGWANQDVIGNYAPKDFQAQMHQWENQDALNFLAFQGKVAFFGATAGAGTVFSATAGVVSGGVSGYESGGWKGAAVGAAVGGTVGKVAPWLSNRVIQFAEDSGVGAMFGRTAIFSGVNGFGGVMGTGLTNAWTGKPLADDMWQSFAINAMAPVFSGESFLWGAGGDVVYGAKVANGFSWVTGMMAAGGTGLDPKADHGFISNPPATQAEPSAQNYGDGPAGTQATPLDLEQPTCAGGAPNYRGEPGAPAARCNHG